MELTDRFVVNAAPDDVWDLLWDLPRVAQCLPGCEGIEMIDGEHYRARMHQKVGMFSVSIPLDLEIAGVEHGKRVELKGGGKDRMGNTLRVSNLAMELKNISDSETEISYLMDFALYGKLATLGNSMVKRKAEEMRMEFTRRIRVELEDHS